ncbi:MAG: amino acid adenylation domain-containing protein [Gammaproteobacteria bacterium]
MDRKALPAPEGRGAEGYVPPCTPTEELLAGIWAEVLRQERVGRHDNFFELGGHSLLAVTLIERMRQNGLHADVRALFTTPTLAALAVTLGGEPDLIEVPPNRIPPQCEAITPEMLPLVELTAAEIERLVSGVPGGAANVQDIYPLAPLQEGILFHHLMGTEGDAYLLSGLYGFDSRGRLEGFVGALQAVVKRNDILRTAVVWEGVSEPVQVVWREAPVPVEEVVLDPARGDVAEQLYARFDPRHYRIDVRQAPLLRVYIAQDAAQGRWLFLLLLHHLAGDHTTLEVIEAEIEAHLLGQAAQLPVPQPFRNFVAQARLGVSQQEHEAFFRGLLGDVEEPTAPFGLLDVRGEGRGIAEARLELDAGLAQRLRERARKLGVSAASLCHLAWAQVLARASGREEVVFGTVLFGRMQGGAGVERMMGLFINTLPVRIRVGEEGVEASVRGTHTLLADLLRHEHASLALAQRCSGVPAPAPLFSALLNYRYSQGIVHAPSAEAMQAWEGVEGLYGEERTNYPLTLSVDDLGEGFRLTAQVQDPIDPRRVCDLMHTALEGLVEALERAPTRAVRSLDVLPEAERRQVLVEWNATEAEYPKEWCIHQLFEAQVERTPEAVAVVFEDEWLTYRALNARANQLAHHLQGLGVGPEVLVGVCAERSLGLIVGLLGVLKAGGAYVPLDPSYPPERLAFMLEDAQVAVLLIQAHLEATLPKTRAQVLCLDREWETIAKEPQGNPPSRVIPENLAYVIYTSGSTGRPKGTLLPHRGLCNVSEAQVRTFGLGPGDRVLQFASLSFDASTFEIVMALRGGATLCLGRRESLLPGPALIRLLQDMAITLVTLPPSALAPLPTEELSGLRIITVAGEACSAELAARWAEAHRFFNLYGPTEGTIWATTEEYLSDGRTLPIGRPLINTQVYLLDPHLQPVPIGVPGELYIGGAGLARGYLHRPELTPERFIPHPFSEAPGARLYRTGDLVRYLPEGHLEFLGRLDHQVKVRGFRIELGEIEACLGGHPGIREVVVLAREDHPGEKRLVAYVVAQEEPAPSVSELRGFLKERLPEYMVPSAFVGLEALPLTPNGKVDRKALPAPEGRGVAEGYVPPCTPTEELLAGIWTEVLRQERVGRHDNFFELGGDSILCIQVIARAQQAGLRLTPKQLFQYQSVAELAVVVGTGPTIEADQELVSGAVPLTPIQRWFFEQGLPAPQHFNQAFLLEVESELEPKWAQRVVRQLLVHHDALRLRFIPEGTGWRQVHAGLEEAVPFAVVDLSGLAEAQQRPVLEAGAAEQQGSLNLSSGPLLRGVLFKLGAERPGRLLIVIHHLVVDGVSWRVLLEDFQRAYQQLRGGQALQLPPKTTAFKAWAERLWAYGHSEAVHAEIDYWLSESRREVRPLPRDYAVDPEANTVTSTAHVAVALSAEQTRALLQEVPPVYHTQINDVLLMALVQSFRRWTEAGSLLLDLEGHGREELFAEVDLSRTVGWFTSLFPVCLELGAEPPGEALKAVKEQLRRIPNKGIGYGVLRYLHPEAEVRAVLQALPPPEISFNYLGQLDQALSESSLFRPARESSGPPHSPLGRRPHLLDVNGWVAEGRLHLHWSYSERVHRRATVERLAQGSLEALEALIEHCQSPEAGGYTLSDFPLAQLDQDELDKAFEEVEFELEEKRL